MKKGGLVPWDTIPCTQRYMLGSGALELYSLRRDVGNCRTLIAALHVPCSAALSLGLVLPLQGIYFIANHFTTTFHIYKPCQFLRAYGS